MVFNGTCLSILVPQSGVFREELLIPGCGAPWTQVFVQESGQGLQVAADGQQFVLQLAAPGLNGQLSGRWEGAFLPGGRAQPIPVAAEFSGTQAAVAWGSGCFSAWLNPRKIAADATAFTEQVTSGECYQGGSVVVSTMAADTLLLDWSHPQVGRVFGIAQR